MFHYRGKLDESTPKPFQELIHLQTPALRGAVYGCHQIVVRTGGVKLPYAIDYTFQARRSPTVTTVAVVNLRRPVHRHPEQELMLRKKSGPFVSNQRSIGLEGIVNLFAALEFFLKLYRFFVEIQAQHQRLAAVPVKCHFRNLASLYIAADITFKLFHAHPRLMAAIYFRLVQVVAVGTVKVAERAGRFQHQIESQGAGKPPGVLQGKSILDSA